MGDGPADAVNQALRSLVATRAASSLPKPTVPEVLGSLAAALRIALPDCIEGGDGVAVHRVVASQESGPEIRAGGEGLGAGDPIVDELVETICAVAQCYLESWDRKPRLSEVLESFLFVLGALPDRYLSGAETMVLEKLAVE